MISSSDSINPPWKLDHLPDDSFQSELEKWAVMDFEQPIRHMDAEIRVDTDQVGIEGGMVDLRQR
jgi:hypothetical protein